MEINIDQNTIYFAGLLTLKQINPKLVENKISRSKIKVKQIDVTKIEAFDTAGAYFILKVLKDLELTREDLIFDNEKDKKLIELVANNFPTKIDKSYSHKSNIVFTSIYTLGKNTNNLLLEVKTSIGFLGAIFLGYLILIRKPYKSFFSIVLNIAYDSTIKALSIIILLSLIIGLVLTYLPLNLMMQYGTQIFVVDMLGISSFREFAPLFTAIIIAGRSGSAFTSEIGIMKVNEEIDALQTIGEDPIQRLVLPRITALIISLPVLTVIAMIANITGGIIIADIIAGITPLQFIERLFSNVNVNHFYIGLLKTPFFALVIAGIGCHQGLAVRRDSQSVGKATTTSVVYSIFLIIVVDAIFAVALNGVA
ncbi:MULTISPECIES: MlaE family ABC transporter permease [Francisella]|uniref:ABC transporter permease n=1 Tax=Francisella opportunistica TaxID=2016517 RepID=A0A345JQI7_9GAMM|nr:MULTISPECIES: ABC transporter permease [Francisella]APC91288.1 ABC-type transport system involved in resistance to organic solvents, permease component [Francisella sp. MA067296]AXH29583.1 ABC transporter permease [Francisella opportunistica]AXH31234.1 ABC transporter permease [Francisella opportunistica]AXH32881.1 ABC transporter permease [Francisella opportunistica]